MKVKSLQKVNQLTLILIRDLRYHRKRLINSSKLQSRHLSNLRLFQDFLLQIYKILLIEIVLLISSKAHRKKIS